MTHQGRGMTPREAMRATGRDMHIESRWPARTQDALADFGAAQLAGTVRYRAYVDVDYPRSTEMRGVDVDPELEVNGNGAGWWQGPELGADGSEWIAHETADVVVRD